MMAVSILQSAQCPLNSECVVFMFYLTREKMYTLNNVHKSYTIETDIETSPFLLFCIEKLGQLSRGALAQHE